MSKFSIPTLEGELVRLEPLHEDHFDTLLPIATDPTNWTWMRDSVRNADELRSYIANAIASTQLPWVTVLKTTGKAAGMSRFIDLDLENRTVEIGNTWLAPAFRATHVNPEAKLLQLTYAFQTLGLRRVALKTHHENLRSQAAIRKLGAQYEGTFRNHLILNDGSTRHTVWFSITHHEWPAVRAGLQARLAHP